MSGDHDGGAFRPRDLSPKTPSPDISFLSDTRQGNLQEHTLGPTTSETIGGGAGVSWGFPPPSRPTTNRAPERP